MDNDILEGFNDRGFREACEVKKVGRIILHQALDQLREKDESYKYLSDNIQEVVDKVIEIKPELERDTWRH